MTVTAPSPATHIAVHRCVDRVSLARAFALAPPSRNERTGAVVYEAALAVPGVHEYPWGRCLTPPEVLADEAWTACLEGVPVVDDDGRDHAEGVTVAEIADRAVGSVLRGWWDEAQAADLGRVVIDRQRGLDRIADGQIGVSVAYDADVVTEAGTWEGQEYSHRQVRRFNAHNIALTRNPRHVVTRIQADSTAADREDRMDPKALIEALLNAPTREDIAKALADAKAGDSEGGMGEVLMALLERLLASEGARMASDAKCADLQRQMDALKPTAAEGEATAEGEAEAEDAAEDIGPIADALRLAERYGVAVEKGMTLDALRRAVATKAGVKSADSLPADALVAVLDCLPAVTPVADAWESVRARATHTAPTPAEQGRSAAFT